MGTTVKRSKHQTGRTSVHIDRKMPALPPGKRRSAKGKTYTENRRNRSDRSRSRML